jgi:tripartite-type tricarboxylate transporter receptor subunit TctC
LKAGSIRGIAVAAEQRLPQLPDIPTYAEAGFPGIIASTWVGIFAPAGTDKAILDKLNRAVNDVVGDPATQAQFQALQTEFRIGDRKDAEVFFRHDVAQWRKMIGSIGLAQ